MKCWIGLTERKNSKENKKRKEKEKIMMNEEKSC